MQLMWLVIAIVFAIAEIITPSLALIWFSLGALATMILSKFIENVVIQVILFGVISLTLLVIMTKKIVIKDKNHNYDTNLQALLNKKALVKEDIHSNKIGIVVMDNEEWSAKSIDNDTILQGEIVEVLKIEGVKLIVKKYKGGL